MSKQEIEKARDYLKKQNGFRLTRHRNGLLTIEGQRKKRGGTCPETFEKRMLGVIRGALKRLPGYEITPYRTGFYDVHWQRNAQGRVKARVKLKPKQEKKGSKAT